MARQERVSAQSSVRGPGTKPMPAVDPAGLRVVVVAARPDQTGGRAGAAGRMQRSQADCAGQAAAPVLRAAADRFDERHPGRYVEPDTAGRHHLVVGGDGHPVEGRTVGRRGHQPLVGRPRHPRGLGPRGTVAGRAGVVLARAHGAERVAGDVRHRGEVGQVERVLAEPRILLLDEAGRRSAAARWGSVSRVEVGRSGPRWRRGTRPRPAPPRRRRPGRCTTPSRSGSRARPSRPACRRRGRRAPARGRGRRAVRSGRSR